MWSRIVDEFNKNILSLMKTCILIIAASEINSVRGRTKNLNFKFNFCWVVEAQRLRSWSLPFRNRLYYFSSTVVVARPGLDSRKQPYLTIDLSYSEMIKLKCRSRLFLLVNEPIPMMAVRIRVCALWSMDTHRFHWHAGEIRCWTRGRSRITNSMLYDILIVYAAASLCSNNSPFA